MGCHRVYSLAAHGTAREVAEAAFFLVSDKAAFITARP
jgi:hypothetical protein